MRNIHSTATNTVLAIGGVKSKLSICTSISQPPQSFWDDMRPKEGIIKYNCFWEKGNLVNKEYIRDIISVRNKLHKLNLIGVDSSGIAYGNISKRFNLLNTTNLNNVGLNNNLNKFIITASNTGKYKYLPATGYSIVKDFSIEKNWLKCIGLKQASSESLSHAIIYESLPNVNYIIHIHNYKLWNKYINKLPTTNQHAEYGSPEMAYEIFDLISTNSHINSKKIFVMGGHKNGLISFGQTLKQTFNSILDLI